jgi:TatA/E family protein of Tat protein translocase
MGDHWLQLIIVMVIGVLFFGAKRLPEMGSAVGKTIKEFQKSMREVSSDNSANTAAVTPPVERPQVAAPAQPSLATPQNAAPTPVETVHE